MKYSCGIDVSGWQDNSTTAKEIDWTLARSYGVRFVINRAVFSSTVDRIFLDSMRDQKENGYIRSAYGFIDYRYGNIEDQAKAFAKVVSQAGGVDMPYVFADFEKANSQWPDLPPRSVSLDILWRYMSTVESELGLICGFYGNQAGIRYTLQNGGVSYIDIPDWLKEKPLWIAHPIIPQTGESPEDYIARMGTRPNFYGQWDKWTFWQYSWKGPGIKYGMESNDLDMNYFNGTDQDLENLCGISEDNENMWEDNVLIAAFDKIGQYAPVDKVDFSALKDAGFYAVMLRCGTSDTNLNYDQPDASYLPNVKYGEWFRAATSAGLRVLIDYDFNAMLDSVNAYDGSVTKRHINQLISGGLKPVSGGGIMLTMERNTWKEGSRNITCMANMFSKDAKNVFDSMWQDHNLVAGVRTGRWFLDMVDDTGERYGSQLVWVDKGEDILPLFMARPKKVGQTIIGDAHSLIADIPDPAITYVSVGNVQVNEQAHFLYYGNNTKWSGWEVVWAKHDAVKDASSQNALFRVIMWNGNEHDFDNYFNFPGEVIPPSVSESPSLSPSFPQDDESIKTILEQISDKFIDLANLFKSLPDKF